ncbi:MAG: hypothetical protein H6606_04265 [Flavobacteriales bacterium]|nr:hypothetical protein [Flavobacteriales bacterium]
MKRYVAIGLLLGIVMQLLVSLAIIVRFEFNRDYITEVFCINKDKPELNCHGTCHLNKQLQKQNVLTGDDPAELVELNFVFFAFRMTQEFQLSDLQFVAQNFYERYTPFNSSAEASEIFHPPRG